MSARLELVLYHALDATGLVQWSTAAPTGPWTDSRLAAPTPAREALDAWATAIGAAASRTVTFTWDGSAIDLTVSGGSLWLKLTPTLQELFGFGSSVISNGDTSGQPAALASLPIGRTYPREVEQSELSEYRGARVTAYHWGRSGEVTLDYLISPELWATLEGTALGDAHGAVKVTWDNEDDFGEDDLDGSLLVFPTSSDIEPREGGETLQVVHVTGTLLDPGDTAPAGQSTAWAEAWRAVPYGYTVHYFVTIEGLPLLFCEVAGDAIAPTGYTLDASLVIDRSSKVGPVVTGASSFAAAFDLDLRLLDTQAVRALMASPSKFTRLSSDAAATDTALYVDSLADWQDGDMAHVGTSGDVVTDILPNRLILADRGAFGRLRSYKAGALVTDTPRVWENRRVELRAALRDPVGRYVQGADVLTDALAVGGFYVAERPARAGLEWSIPCRDQVRRLTQPLGVAASGRALWQVDDDGLVTVDPNATFTLDVDIDGSNVGSPVTVRPFYGQTGTLRRSQVLAGIASSLEAATVGWTVIASFAWRRGADMPLDPPSGTYDAFGLYADLTVTSSDQRVQSRCTAQTAGLDFDRMFQSGSQREALPVANTTVTIFLGLRALSTVATVGLSVVLDKGTPTSLPSTGWIALESGGRTAYKRYTARAADSADPSQVNLTLDPATGLDSQEIATAVSGGDDAAEVSVKFYWRDTGKVYDVLRRAIVSTGDAQNGLHDTLPRGQGLGLPDLDAESFPDVFDVFFRDLVFDVGSEAGTSLETLFGGILRLSQRAITSRRAADGSSVDIAAIRIGSVDSLPVATIDDAALVGGGPRPVRVLSVFTAPQAIEVKCRTLPVGDAPAGDASISIDVGDVDAVTNAWSLDIYGVARSALLPAAQAWGVGLARAIETRQVLELLLPPWYDVQGGDCVELDLTDPNLWDYAAGTSGEPGYVGTARVLGVALQLDSGVQAVTVMCDGLLAAGPLCPSLAITAVNGGGSTPTSIDVDDEYYDLLTAAKDGESSWKVLAYLPGQDSGRAEYTVSTVTLPGGSVARLTVTAYPSAPSVTLTTSHRITWPVSTRSTDDQERYAHADQRFQWGA